MRCPDSIAAASAPVLLNPAWRQPLGGPRDTTRGNIPAINQRGAGGPLKAARPKWRTVPLALMKRGDPMAAAARRRQPPYPQPPPHAPPPPCPRCRNHADARGAYAHTYTRSQARGVCGDGGHRRTTTAAAAVPRGHACRPSLPQRPRRLPAAAVRGCRSWQSARVAAAPDAASHAAAVARRPVAATAAAAAPGQGARGALAAHHSVGKCGRVCVASKKQ